MNDFYYEIDEAIHSIERIIEEDYQDFNLAVIELTNHLTTLEYMLSRVPYYISERGAVPTDIEYFNSIINYGRNYEGHYIPPFIEDGKINEQEKVFLEEVKAFFVNTRNLLESEENREIINPDISLEKFQDIISETIYGESKFRSFLEKYIDAKNQ